MLPRKHKFIDGVEYALCSKCNRFFPLNLFYKKANMLDGLTSQCKVCIKEYDQANKERIKKYQAEYGQKNKEKLSEYKKKWAKESEVDRSEYDAEYREKHKEAYKEWFNEYFKDPDVKARYRENTRRYRERKRKAKGEFSNSDWEKCLIYFDFKDAYTGKDMDTPSIDHVIPITNGGKHDIRNVVPCENSINKKKNNAIFEKWYRKQDFFSEERLNRIYDWMEGAE